MSSEAFIKVYEQSDSSSTGRSRMPISRYWTTALLLALALTGTTAQQEVLSASHVGYHKEYPYHRFNHTIKKVAVIGAGTTCVGLHSVYILIV